MKTHIISSSGGPVVIDHWINNSTSDAIIQSKKKDN
jgi:hypothetical protein